MVTLGYSLLKNNFLKRKVKSVPGQHFSKASEGSKGQSIQSQRDLFEKIRHVTLMSLGMRIPSIMLSRS